MIAWIRTHLAATVTLVLAALVTAGLTVLYTGADEAREAAHRPDPVLPLAAPAEFHLTPELDTTNDLENTAAVRAIRTSYTAFYWAKVTNSSNFAQFNIYLGMNKNFPFRFITLTSRDYKPDVPLGPPPFTPIAITENEDGTTTVDGCESTDWRYYSFDSDEIEPQGAAETSISPQSFLLSPPKEAERAALANYDLPEDLLLIRDDSTTSGTSFDCTGVTPVQQEFTNWQENLWG